MNATRNAPSKPQYNAAARKLQAVPGMPQLSDFLLTKSGSLVPRRVLGDSVRILDFLVVIGTGLLVAELYVGDLFNAHGRDYLLAVAMTGFVLVLALDYQGLYKVTKFSNVFKQLPRIALSWAVSLSALVAVMFFLKVTEEFSRVWLTGWIICGTVAFLVTRIGLYYLVQYWARTGRLYRRAVIFGGGASTVELLQSLEADKEADVRICGVFDDVANDRDHSHEHNYRLLGSLDELIDLARKTRIDLVIIALPLSAQERIVQVADQVSQLPVEVKLPAAFSQVQFAPGTYTRVGSVPMLDLAEKPVTAWGGVGKWLFDKVIAALALVLLAPLMVAVAVAIKLDSRGPVLFRQKRYGFNNELIEVFKFRSMYTDMCDEKAAKLVTKGDPRVSRVGRFIRKTSIDELPQLFNVLIGNLSLVGPRPHAVSANVRGELYEHLLNSYFKRHKVKPGITGWAQIHGMRGETDTREKIEKRLDYDLYYIENFSIFLDVYILLNTPRALLETEQAY